MIPIMDFQERSLNGPVMKADDFDLAFAMKLRELVEKYQIKYDPEKFIVDDATADGVFNAGVELLAEVGLYHLSTQRVIKYTKEEILEFTAERRENPAKFKLGSGDDEMTMQYRNGNDPRPPVMYAGAAGAISEEEFLPLIISFAREPVIKGMGISGGIVKVGDVEPKAGTISEIHCGLWEQEKLKEALDHVSRPGLCLGLLCTVSTVGATMECLDRGFRTAKNTHIGVHVIPEQKIDWDRLLLAHFCEDRGIVPWQSSMSLIGGLCRNAADSAVGLIANMLGQMSYAHGPMCSFFPTGLDGSWGTRPCIWSVCAATRASGRNIRLATGSGTVSSYQWGQTKVGILQEAAMALLYTASGFSYSWLAGSPHEAAMLDGIMKATCTMDNEKVENLAGVILNRIDELVKTEQPKATIHTFKDIYDVDTIEPLPKVVAVFNESKEELAKLGVPLNY